MALLTLLLVASAPGGAAASSVREIAATAPAGQGVDVPVIKGVSSDGRRLIVEAGSRAWSVDAAARSSRPLVENFAASYSQSPSGAYVAWAARSSAGGCARDVQVVAPDSGDEPRKLKLPARYARGYVDAIAVSDAGSVTLRVARCDIGGFASAGLGQALLSSEPGASELRVVASTPYLGRAQWPVSQDGRVFALCAPVSLRTRVTLGEVTVIDSRNRSSVRSARLPAPYGVDCVASDAGTATMSAIRDGRARNTFTNVGVTVGGQRTPKFTLPGGTRDHGIGFESVSPDGAQVITRFGYCGACREATVIHTTTGRYSRPVRLPLPRGASDGGPFTYVAGSGAFTDGKPFAPWSPYGPALVVNNGEAVFIFNPRTLRTSRPMKVRGAHREARVEACFLPSGRILLHAIPRGARADLEESLFVTDAAHKTATRIDTSQLGPISSVSCEAAKTADKVFVTTKAGGVYELSASSVDGSPLTVEGT